MKALFIQQDIFRNYGVMVLSSVLKANGHSCDLLIDMLEKDIIGKIKSVNPDIICFSIPSTRVSWMCNLAKKIKSETNKLIVVGGPHPTFFPEIINEDCVDIACAGEGEYALLELLDKLEKGKDITTIKNIAVKMGGKIYRNPPRNLIENLDELPYPDREIYLKYDFIEDQNTEYFMAGRGCPYNCSFCFNKKYNALYKGKGKILRRHSVSRVISEIKDVIRKKDNITHLVFRDDTFILGPKEWFDEFFARYKKEINLPFSIMARADLVTDEIIKKLKDAGCHSIRMGIESGNAHLRENVLRKGVTNEQILRAARIIKKYDIKLQVYNIIGIPGETVETALETYELSMKIHPDYAWCSLLQPYPGTEILDIAVKQNLISKDYNIRDLDNSYFQDLPLNLDNKKEMISLQKLFQFGNSFRIPKSVMRRLIKIPPNILFDYIFRVNYGLGIRKLDNVAWKTLVKTAVHSKNYFSKK